MNVNKKIRIVFLRLFLLLYLFKFHIYVFIYFQFIYEFFRTHVIITVHVHFEAGEEKIILNEIQNTSFDSFCKICDIDYNISALSTGNF